MVGRSAGRLGVHPFKAQLFQIELLDESIDNPDRVLPGYLVFQPAREQCVLRPFLTLHEPRHPKLPPRPCRDFSRRWPSLSRVFTQPGPKADRRL